MITQKLKYIFGLSVLVFALHGIEEFFTHFYAVDAQDQAIFGLLAPFSLHGATFVVFQLMFWLLLTVSFLLLVSEKWRFYMLAIIGAVYVYEIHHIYKAIVSVSYYPGLYTALIFPFITFFFWKEWLRVRQTIV